MITHVMLDIETFGKVAKSVIPALGAVKFSAGVILEHFYARVDPVSCERIGLVMDVDTVRWWMRQPDAARLEMVDGEREPITAALERFAAWIGDPDAQLWVKGASFDFPLLGAAYDAARIRRPWKYTKERCYRTIAALFPDIPIVYTGTAHKADDDAADQARHLMVISTAKGINLDVLPPTKPAKVELAPVGTLG